MLITIWSNSWLPPHSERIARLCKFCLRQRHYPCHARTLHCCGPWGDQVNDIASLHRHFNALQLTKEHQVSYKPFHNQLRKESGLPCL